MRLVTAPGAPTRAAREDRDPRPEPGSVAPSLPQVAAELRAPKPLVESGLWVDGKELVVKGRHADARDDLRRARGRPRSRPPRGVERLDRLDRQRARLVVRDALTGAAQVRRRSVAVQERVAVVARRDEVSLIVRGETQRIRFQIEPALSFVPDAREPPNGCWPTTAPVGLSLT